MSIEGELLVCVECGAETPVAAEDVYEQFSTRKDGKPRRRRGWIDAMATAVSEWRCSRCLDRAEEGAR